MIFQRANDLRFIVALVYVLGAGYGPKLRQSLIALRREVTTDAVSKDQERRLRL